MFKTCEIPTRVIRFLCPVAVLFSIQLHHIIGVAAPPKNGRVAIMRVDVADMTVKEAEAAIQCERVCVRGNPIGTNMKLPSLALKTRDGNVCVHMVSIPDRVRELCRQNYNLSIDFEGRIRRAPLKSPNFPNCVYASDQTRFVWEARDKKGVLIEKGESNFINGRWKETSLPIDQHEERSQKK
jgi:hypothetical protein